MSGERSYFVCRDRSIFTESDIERFKRKAVELNHQKMGDQVAVYLTKP